MGFHQLSSTQHLGERELRKFHAVCSFKIVFLSVGTICLVLELIVFLFYFPKLKGFLHLQELHFLILFCEKVSSENDACAMCKNTVNPAWQRVSLYNDCYNIRNGSDNN